MCQDVTARGRGSFALLAAGALAICALASAQPLQPTQPDGLAPDWRRLGTSAYEAGLASPAAGPVERVWFSPEGGHLYVRTQTGRVYASEGVEASWQEDPRLTPPDEPAQPYVARLPEPGATIRAADSFGARLYAFGEDIHYSADAGQNWVNRTAWLEGSILGGAIQDLAVSPVNPDEVVAVNGFGVWRSLDAGLSWCGLNEGLPNLPVRRLLATPSGDRGVRVLLNTGEVLEWLPGEKNVWTPAEDPAHSRREESRFSAALQTGQRITAADVGEDFSYAGSDDGTLWVSRDEGRTWRWSRLGDGGAVEAIFVPPGMRSVAFVAFSEPENRASHPRVLRTADGGTNWVDITGELPPGPVWGLTGDSTGTALYVAGERGLFLSVDVPAAGRLGERWTRMSGTLPPAAVMDVRLDEAGNQVFVALAGYGVYSAPAPHRFWNVEVASAADLNTRTAAPGSLLTVLGGRLVRAQAGLAPAPVLFASAAQSQLQVPFEVSGPVLRLALELEQGRYMVSLPLAEVSPAIFVDRDGGPMLMDGDTGLLLDASNPARSGMTVHVLATGLGRVLPAWRTGVAAPLAEPPRVAAAVRAFLGGAPVEVTRATLAPGYIGFYLVEIRLPSLLDAGASELYLQAGGRQSNKVRIYLEP